MPINPTTLKALIDTQITNETVNFAITPAEVGGRMKDTIDYTTEQIAASELLANKSTNVATDGLSNTKYPSVKAVKDYADGIVVGLLDDRGNYDASSNLFPATGGSGVAGAVLKGDLWYISVTGTLGGVSVPVGASVRALVDTPAQTSTNWSILNVGLGFTPENVVNKSTDVALGTSDTLYPTQNAVKTYVDANSGGVSYTEESRNTSSLDDAQDPAILASKITKTFTRAYVTSGIDNFLGLSNIGKVRGDFFVVQNKSTTLDLVIVPLDYATFLQPNGFASQINFTVKANTYARFTLADTNSGSDKVFMVEVINPLGEFGDTQTSGTINLSATPQVLPFDINSCATQGGKAFLPATTEIGKQVYVLAVQNNIEIRANSENTNFMFVKFQTFIPSVTLLNKQMYRFTYIGFGSGAGGTVGGYWLAELIEIEIPTYKAFITQAGSATPIISTVSKNTTGKTFTIARQNAGVFLIEPDVAFTNIEKVFITVQNQGGYNVLNSISISNNQIFWLTYDFNGVSSDLIDYSTITIEILP